jgi:hypothetical protein
LMIDLAAMRGVDLDPHRRPARAAGGSRGTRTTGRGCEPADMS